MDRTLGRLGGLLVLCSLAAACDDGGSTPVTTSAADTPTTAIATTSVPATTRATALPSPPLSTTPAGTGPAPSSPDDLDAEIEFARADAADWMSVPLDSVEVAEVSAVTWPSTALGCPRTDGEYEQEPVAGYRIVVVADGNEIAYHGADGAMPSKCLFLD